jgi:hypothetical protein
LFFGSDVNSSLITSAFVRRHVASTAAAANASTITASTL